MKNMKKEDILINDVTSEFRFKVYRAMMDLRNEYLETNDYSMQLCHLRGDLDKVTDKMRRRQYYNVTDEEFSELCHTQAELYNKIKEVTNERDTIFQICKDVEKLFDRKYKF